MDKASYLARVRYAGDPAPDLETLRRLHLAHLTAVAFENLDIHIGNRIVLDEAAFFDKIVARRRGGYCYELNGLFAWLLRELGFDVTMLSAGVYDPNADRFGPDGDHLCLLVALDQRWLVDVGFGASFLEPLSLDDQADRVEHGTAYRVAADGDDGWTMSAREPGGDWVPQYRFTLRPRRLFDFTYANHYMQTSPDSIFTRKRVCTRATADGRITMSDMRFIETTSGGRDERPVTSAEELTALLIDRFNVTLSAAEIEALAGVAS